MSRITELKGRIVIRMQADQQVDVALKMTPSTLHRRLSVARLWQEQARSVLVMQKPASKPGEGMPP